MLDAARAIIAALEEAKLSQDNASIALDAARANITDAESHIDVVRAHDTSCYLYMGFCAGNELAT